MLASHDLAALVAVADGGSIHCAASILGRTQPAVTQAIQRLEEAVGFALLDRSGYRVKLTARGETFVKRARVTVKQARDLRAFAAVLSRGVEARLVQTARLVANEDDDLASLPQILVADFDDPATHYGVVEGHRYWRASDHRIKAAAIAAGAGWGSVPAATVAAALRDGTLRAISYRRLGPRSRRPFFLYRRSEKSQGPVATSIWETIRQARRAKARSPKKR